MAEPASDACPACGDPIDDHTVRDLRTHLAEARHPLTNEFSENADGEPAWIEQPMVRAGALNLRAAIHEVPGYGTLPVLLFDFEGEDRKMLPPIALMLTDVALRDVPRLVRAAVDAALKAARRAR